MKNNRNRDPRVLIGSSIPAGLDQIKIHQQLKQGDIVLTNIPESKEEALAVARFCKENRIYLCFGEFLFRGETTRGKCYLRPVGVKEFHSKEDIDEIIDAAGPYFFGRMVLGESGGMLYWPKAYTIGRKSGQWPSLPACNNVRQAEKAFLDYCRERVCYETDHVGKGPLMDVDSSLALRHHAQVGVDILCLESFPGDQHLMHAAIRGAARAFDKPWGVHIAMKHYGGVCFDELWQKRWRNALWFSYFSGARFIYPESGHYVYNKETSLRGYEYGFSSAPVKRVRRTLRQAWQFARIHQQPKNGPVVPLAFVQGAHDGAPGLWNRYAWGQYHDSTWLEGPAERGWERLRKCFRKEDWGGESVQGACDASGNPPCGQYDIVPVESPLEKLRRYRCLAFPGWNTMTAEIYEKLKRYVSSGGHLLMFLPQLSTHVKRGAQPRLFRRGDYSDLFGVKISGKMKQDVWGIKCIADASLKSYRFPLWRINTDPRFLGQMTPARVELVGGRVISSFSNFYRETAAQLQARPALVEHSLGKGVAYLVTAWDYPGAIGMARWTDDILRTLLQGEQDALQLLGSDRVRYAIYEEKLPGSRKKYRVVYLLNTDPDCAAAVSIAYRGRRTEDILVPPNDLQLAYLVDSTLLIPENKFVDLEHWAIDGEQHRVRFFSLESQTATVHNLGKTPVGLVSGRHRCVCPPRGSCPLRLPRRVDPQRREFFAPDFLTEPPVNGVRFNLPY